MNKHRFFGEGINIGHKLHLNVALNNVKKVSEYLIRNRILHKYLSEEKLMTGKFLLYMAAQKNTDKIAKQISDDLKMSCANLFANGEVEYAPNVVGRFFPRGDDFAQYGLDSKVSLKI